MRFGEEWAVEAGGHGPDKEEEEEEEEEEEMLVLVLVLASGLTRKVVEAADIFVGRYLLLTTVGYVGEEEGSASGKEGNKRGAGGRAGWRTKEEWVEEEEERARVGGGSIACERCTWGRGRRV
eukprot:756514-Hanusia_phi.AAC.1